MIKRFTAQWAAVATFFVNHGVRGDMMLEFLAITKRLAAHEAEICTIVFLTSLTIGLIIGYAALMFQVVA